MIRYYCDKCGKEMDETLSEDLMFDSAFNEMLLCKTCKKKFEKVKGKFLK